MSGQTPFDTTLPTCSLAKFPEFVFSTSPQKIEVIIVKTEGFHDAIVHESQTTEATLFEEDQRHRSQKDRSGTQQIV